MNGRSTIADVEIGAACVANRPEAGVRRDAQKQSSAVVRRRVLRDWAVHIVDRLNSHSEMSRKYKRLQLTRADYLV
jgi:hypothetical protein